ncbi:MAG TPA: hypothetical protein VF841_02440 [Anaeromyxobacter sp.]
MQRMLGIAAALALAGCQTVFTGAPKITDGPKGCRAACDAWGMDLAGMVKMGEYSDGCICQVRPGGAGAPAAQPPRPSSDASGPGPGGPQAVAGVWVQMQAAAAAAAQQSAEASRQASQQGYFEPPASPSATPGFQP